MQAFNAHLINAEGERKEELRKLTEMFLDKIRAEEMVEVVIFLQRKARDCAELGLNDYAGTYSIISEEIMRDFMLRHSCCKDELINGIEKSGFKIVNKEGY